MIGISKKGISRRATSKDGLAVDGLSALQSRVKGLRWAYNFDSVDDRGEFAARAITPDGDIDIEWQQQGGVLNSLLQTIVNQSFSATITDREFMIRWNNGLLLVYVGGTPVIRSTDAINQTDGIWRFYMTGTTVSVYKNGLLAFTNSGRARGAAREPAAGTTLAARNNAGTFTEFFQGAIFNLKINGTSWALDNRNQVSQPSTGATSNTITLINSVNGNWEQVVI